MTVTDPDELKAKPWFVVEDDMIGGYAVSHVNKPTSKLNIHEGEVEIANFIDKVTATHICDLHNEWLNSQAAPTKCCCLYSQAQDFTITDLCCPIHGVDGTHPTPDHPGRHEV